MNVSHEIDIELQKKIASDSLERYSGSPVNLFQPYVLLTNFPKYVEHFAETRKLTVYEGSAFKAAHSPEENISILDFKMGSPVAALVVDLCAFLPIKACLLLGMCGGLREHYQVGEYFVPIASVRGEGTSDFYFPSEVPAMANFLVQKAVTNVLEEESFNYHIGITHTTNIRFWEFEQNFRKKLQDTQVQSIEMECATLFAASYKKRLPLGAVLLVSDIPLRADGIKTKQTSQMIFSKYTAEHVELGVRIIENLKILQERKAKGASRGIKQVS